MLEFKDELKLMDEDEEDDEEEDHKEMGSPHRRNRSNEDDMLHGVIHNQINQQILLKHVSGLISAGGAGEIPKAATPNLNNSISNFVNDYIRESPSPNE